MEDSDNNQSDANTPPTASKIPISDPTEEGKNSDDSCDSTSSIDSEGSSDGINVDESSGADHSDPRDTASLKLGMYFNNITELKDAVFRYSVVEKKDLKYKTSESIRLLVICNFEGCPWRLYASKVSSGGMFQIRVFNDDHRCNETGKNKLFKCKRLIEVFLEKLRDNPSLKAKEMRAYILSEFGVRVTLPQCRDAKHKCQKIIAEEHSVEFSRLWDYACELRRTNPGSNIIVQTTACVFRRMYVCFAALREGFIRGCRRVIHLDGAFLKWQFKGEILAAVGRDANDQVYPIAWAIVDVENTENWKWFIENLIEDLALGTGEGLTVITDQQKGLLVAMSNLLPVAEHRMCARHIWSNLKKKNNSEEIRNCFWRAAKCYTVTEFRSALDDLKEVSISAYNELLKHEPRLWSRAFFSTINRCDAVDNNFSESFNASIREARRKPVVRMLEEIRQGIMSSFAKKIKELEDYHGRFTPKAKSRLDQQKDFARQCSLLKNGRGMYEVWHKSDGYAVDLCAVTCSCKRHDLTGIPCSHMISAIWEEHKGTIEPEDLVDDCFTVERWKKGIENVLCPVNGSQLWTRYADVTVLPPKDRKMPGRPKKHNRRKALHESPTRLGRLPRHGMQMTCRHCLTPGHNKRTCPKKNEPPAPRPAKKTRPRKQATPFVHAATEENSQVPPNQTNEAESSKGTAQRSQALKKRSYGVYVSPLTDDTYHHNGEFAVDTSSNTIFPTRLQYQRDIEKLKKRKRASVDEL